jgi:hypothetical protein
MTDRRKHRGPHPEDHHLFCAAAEPALQTAVAELSWLWTRGYAAASSLKLVGDRHALDARQRLAVARCACGDPQLAWRRRHEAPAAELQGRELWIDGFNVLVTVEAALAGAVMLQARDGCYRDMASMHGNYRRIAETLPAIELIGQTLAALQVPASRWLLDQPVSNSGRLKTMLRGASEQHGWCWQIDLLPDPDPVLIGCGHIVASSDCQVLDGAGRWFNLARCVIETHLPTVWKLPLGTCSFLSES